MNFYSEIDGPSIVLHRFSPRCSFVARLCHVARPSHRKLNERRFVSFPPLMPREYRFHRTTGAEQSLRRTVHGRKECRLNRVLPYLRTICPCNSRFHIRRTLLPLFLSRNATLISQFIRVPCLSPCFTENETRMQNVGSTTRPRSRCFCFSVHLLHRASSFEKEQSRVRRVFFLCSSIASGVT